VEIVQGFRDHFAELRFTYTARSRADDAREVERGSAKKTTPEQRDEVVVQLRLQRIAIRRRHLLVASPTSRPRIVPMKQPATTTA
jgi:hypothetical protein